VKRVGTWTVGLSGGLVHEGPIVEGGVVSGWHVGWRSVADDVMVEGFWVLVAEACFTALSF
jgi:hypothetical protein